MLLYSLGGLLTIVAFEALCALALAKYSPLAHTWAVNVTIVVLLFTAACVAAGGRSKRRRFVAGFATVGWLYFLVLVAFASRLSRFDVPLRVRDKLASTHAIEWMYSLIHANNDPSYRYREWQVSELYESGPPGFRFADGTEANWDSNAHSYVTDAGEMIVPFDLFEDITQCVFTLHLALIGGLIAVGLDALALRPLARLRNDVSETRKMELTDDEIDEIVVRRRRGSGS
jgi:hypothetical protein